MLKWLNSVRHASHGIIILIRKERNLRIELSVSFLMIMMGIYFQIQIVEWCLLILCIGGVLAAEAFNSSLETLCDFISPEIRAEIGMVKDLAAAAVLIFAICAAVTGLLIFLPKLVFFRAI